MDQYIALLRGINVGGNNIIKMADLRECLEGIGLKDIRTYIQSGNVIFAAPKHDILDLTQKIERLLTKKFSYASRVLLLSESLFKQVIHNAPKNFGKEPEKYRYDVIYLIEPLTAKAALQAITLTKGVDTVDSSTHALYFSRLISKAPQSCLLKIMSLALFKNTTVRNWNTTTKLLQMLDDSILPMHPTL